MKLADASIQRPVFAVMLVGALVVLGVVSIPRLGIDLWPRIEFPMVVVTTVLEGAAHAAVGVEDRADDLEVDGVDPEGVALIQHPELLAVAQPAHIFLEVRRIGSGRFPQRCRASLVVLVAFR